MRRKRPDLFEVPEVEGGLQDAVEEVTRFFVDLRGVGHFPSPSDSRWIVTWCQAGVPPEVLLRALHAEAVALLRAGSTMRNLSQLRKGVEGELRRYQDRHLGAGRREEPRPARSNAALLAHLDAEVARLEELAQDGREDGNLAFAAAADAARDAVLALRTQPLGPEIAIPALVSAGRRLYDAILDALPAASRAALREEAEASLEGWIRPMSPEVREETVRELTVASLRRRLDVLRPEPLFELWET